MRQDEPRRRAGAPPARRHHRHTANPHSSLLPSSRRRRPFHACKQARAPSPRVRSRAPSPRTRNFAVHPRAHTRYRWSSVALRPLTQRAGAADARLYPFHARPHARAPRSPALTYDGAAARAACRTHASSPRTRNFAFHPPVLNRQRARRRPRAHALPRAQVRQTHSFGTLQEHEFERKWAGCAPPPGTRPAPPVSERLT